MAIWPKHPNGVPRLDDTSFHLPPGDFRSLGSLDFPLTLCRDGRILSGHQQYRYYKRHGIKDFPVRVLPSLPDEELWAVALDLTDRRPEHAARPAWSFQASNGYQVEVLPPLNKAGQAEAIHTALQQAAYLSTRRWQRYPVLLIDSRRLDDVQRANELQAPLGENIKKQRRLNIEAHRRQIEERGRLLRAEGNYQIVHSDNRLYKWPRLNVIFTDPIWHDIATYRLLGQYARGRLEQGGLLFAVAGTSHEPEATQALLESGLTRVDTLVIAYRHTWLTDSRLHLRIRGMWRPVLLFTQGKTRPDPLLRIWSNLVTVYGRPPDSKLYHDWQQPYWPIYYWLKSVTLPGDVIGDPFCGGGTVPLAAKSIGGLTCYATDIDEGAVLRARARLAEECPREGVGFLEKYRCERRPQRSV
jgi:hypothetical protein